MTRLLCLALIWSLTSWSAAAEEAASAPCTDPAYRQFDFWLGQWTAYSAAGIVQGTNHLHTIMGGCAMQENWSSGDGQYQGTSFNFFDSVTNQWHQTWVDNSGGHLLLSGGMVDGSMQLSGKRASTEAVVIDRITWTPLPDGRVRQHWEVTSDDGRTWSDLFDGYYKKDVTGAP